MNDRKQLHALVDSLPEGFLDSAEKYLQSLQTWPLRVAERQAKMALFRDELEQKRNNFLKGGSGTGSWAIDQNSKRYASFHNSQYNWETGEMTLRTFRLYHDFPDGSHRAIPNDGRRQVARI